MGVKVDKEEIMGLMGLVRPKGVQLALFEPKFS